MSTQKDFQKDFQSGPSHSHSSLPRLSSTSYVYPVRSLLEGRIQPAPGSDAPPPISSRSSDDIVEFSRINQGQNPQAPAQFASNLNPSDPNPSQSPQSPAPNAITQTNARSRRRAVSIPGSARLPTTLPPSDASTANPPRRRSSRNKSVVLEQFPGADNPYFPRTFSSISLSSPPGESSNSAMLESVQSSMTAEQVLGSQIQGIFSRGPYSLYASPLPSAPTQSHASTSATFLPSNEIANAPPSAPFSMEDTTPMDGLPAQFTPSFSSEPVATPIATYPRHAETRHNQGVHTDEHGLRLPFNPSEYGIVHLPPLPSSSNASERGLSSASSRTRSSTSGRGSNAKKLLRDALASPNSASASSSAAGSGTSREGPRLATLSSTGASGGTPSSGQSHRGSSQTFSSDGIESSITSDEPYVTFKFKSIEDEHGNHVVVGREGKLEQCEDEPIRTPGAVQGFGVLIAVDEANDVLSVRQVSENSSELLGLPAHYLFGLACFTDILPDSQSCILWDNIEFLTDPDQNAEEEYSPHVFLLSGYGAPGSALPDEPDSVDGKRMWTCWCAAHRSRSLQDGVTTPGLIIMEFEMEKDIMNPLYPPMQRPPTATSPPSKQERHSSGSLPLQQSNRSQSSFGSSSGSGRSTTGNVSLASSGDTVAPSTAAFPPNADVVSPPIGLQGDTDWEPAEEDILESTTSYARPLPALERLRKMTRAYGASADAPDASSRRGRRRRGTPGNASATVGMMDIFAVMAQINEQLGAAPDLETYLKVVVGVIKDLTQFHRVMVYQFDEMWNGQVVAELVDWSQTTDLFRGLHFPAGDIPAQARQLYEINKVRLLYDANQPTARIVVRSKKDLDTPLNMTHCYLRAMSPIHIQYLGNMGVRASMSISIMGFGRLWGLVNCHTYGTHGMRVSFPVRQMLRLLSQAISKNIERLSFAKRLHTRKLINPMASDHHPTGYIVSNADDLLGLFDADFGILVIGEGAKILGPNQHGQEILIMAEYLRLKQFKTIQASQAVVRDFPDLELSAGLEIIAGLLYVPLSSGGQDFIAFLRKGQPRKVRWAGRPYKDGQENKLEPRTSFKMWSETVAGRSRMWTDEQLETAAVLALVYGKFIEVWRERENALQAKKLTNLLLSNASHEVRTPLNHIINYLEMAMNGPLDKETRENLKKSHAASKSLLFTINDLLDLTRLESGNETSFNEPFDLHFAVQEATHLYCKEAERRNIQFNLELMDSPSRVVGDAKKIRTVVQNLTANALKYTPTGSITVSCKTYGEPEGLRKLNQTAVEIIVADTGRGISQEKLASIFREFEQVESSEPKSITDPGVGLGLAVVSRIVEQLGGQLRVDSTAGVGSRFSFLIPLSLATEDELFRQRTSSRSSGSSSRAPLEVYDNSRSSSAQSLRPSPEDINNLIQVMSSNYRTRSRESLRGYSSNATSPNEGTSYLNASRPDHTGFFGVAGAHVPVVIHLQDTDTPQPARQPLHLRLQTRTAPPKTAQDPMHAKLRVLIVEDNDINRTILAKRLTMDGYNVATTTNGQEGLDKVVADRSFDIVLMDLQMPILNGFEATLKIREFELSSAPGERPSHALNGRLPVFAVSASLLERQRDELAAHGMDGWILKPIDFKRLNVILKGVQDPAQRQADVYRPGCNWERGGWLRDGFRNMPRTSY